MYWCDGKVKSLHWHVTNTRACCVCPQGPAVHIRKTWCEIQSNIRLTILYLLIQQYQHGGRANHFGGSWTDDIQFKIPKFYITIHLWKLHNFNFGICFQEIATWPPHETLLLHYRYRLTFAIYRPLVTYLLSIRITLIFILCLLSNPTIHHTGCSCLLHALLQFGAITYSSWGQFRTAMCLNLFSLTELCIRPSQITVGYL